MRLYIAEKPSLGRAIAEVLPQPQRKNDGYITLGNGDVVSWCIGHLLEQAQPEHYDPALKKWKTEDLPIVPKQWKLTVKPKTKKQFSVLKKLIKEASELVNAGDPDREGQILVDEVINYCGISKAKIAATKRCLISDLNPKAVQRSLEHLKNNTDFIPLATSALGRARADWLYGINMTRLCTLKGQKAGFMGVLSIGRVQTPLLGLVVRRDAEIEHFVSKPFYELEVTLNTESGFSFLAKWKPSASCEPYMDEENRVLSRPLVENVASRVIDQSGVISKFNASVKKQQAPLPYNLSSLQIDAAKLFCLSAKQVLDTCQSLYEKQKLITYPRSDCRFLPEGHFKEARQISDAISNNTQGLNDIILAMDTSRKGKAWNDKKVGAHHAIIPTSKKANSSALSHNESRVYELISRQYIMQFLPSFDYRQVIIEASIGGGCFVAKRKEIIALGWKTALRTANLCSEKKTQDVDGGKESEFVEGNTPRLKEGDPVRCVDTKILDKKTSAPKRFNDASLLSAMTGIARYVKDPSIRKILRETDGLGTEATRASIIELLFTRKFLSRHGKEIHSTDIGRELIGSLPESVSLPDMTAQWESQLDEISERRRKYNDFIDPMTDELQSLIDDVSQNTFQGLRGKGEASFKRRKKSRSKSRAASS